MRTPKICTKHRGPLKPLSSIDLLPESQAGEHRHRCARCAYELGIEEGRRQAFQEMGVFVQVHMNPHADKLKTG